jgi:hypothetical protein
MGCRIDKDKHDQLLSILLGLGVCDASYHFHDALTRIFIDLYPE